MAARVGWCAFMGARVESCAHGLHVLPGATRARARLHLHESCSRKLSSFFEVVRAHGLHVLAGARARVHVLVGRRACVQVFTGIRAAAVGFRKSSTYNEHAFLETRGARTRALYR